MDLPDFRTLGRTGLRVSPLALGTMTFGDPSWGADESTSLDILARYVDAGGNFVDTANRYMDGESERVIGAYLAKHPGVRQRLVIASKFALTMDPADPNSGGTGRKAIRRHVADPAGHRLPRPLLAAQLGPAHPAGGDHLHAGRSGPRGQGPLRRQTRVRGQVAVKRQPGTTSVGQTGTAPPQGGTTDRVLTTAH